MRPQLHVLADVPSLGDRDPIAVVRSVLAGGADVVQLRDKSALPEDLADVAGELARIVHAAGRRLVVNDHLDVARAAGADGVHLGPDDLPVEDARRVWPRPALIGASARTVERAVALEAAGADYLGVGPVFGTTSKADAPPAVGVEIVGEIAAAVAIPVVGIGGVGPENAADVIRAGGAGVAVLSSVLAAPDPEKATRRIRRALDGA